MKQRTIAKCLVCNKYFDWSYWFSCPSCFGTKRKNIRRPKRSK